MQKNWTARKRGRFPSLAIFSAARVQQKQLGEHHDLIIMEYYWELVQFYQWKIRPDQEIP